MITTIIMYQIRCDFEGCGKILQEQGLEFIAWTDIDGAQNDIDGSDWSTHPDGKLHRCSDHNPYCVKCGKDAGKYAGERDYMCQSCWDADEPTAPMFLEDRS